SHRSHGRTLCFRSLRSLQYRFGLAYGTFPLAALAPLHRPGARSARRDRCLLLSQTEGDFTVVLKQSRLGVEPLEDRCLLSANVILEWNQLALDAIGQTK